MALGGGVFITQNKTLPGSYINFISAAKASATLSERGYAALAMELDWGTDGEIFTVEAGEFQKNSISIFGYDYAHEKLRGLRDLFLNIRTGYFYKLNTGGVKASCTYGRARCAGVRGNDIMIVIEHNEAATAEAPLYDVTTLLDGVTVVDRQTAPDAAGLVPNAFVEFENSVELALTAGTPFTGGTNGTAQNSAYQDFLDKLESFAVNAVGCLSEDDTIKGLFSNWTKRIRDTVGVKLQCVLHRYTAPDYEGVVSVENNAAGAQKTAAVYWALGVAAGCDVNRSNTNKVYTGEFELDVNYTQTQLEEGIKAGRFMFHKVGDKVRVLEDINTFITVTDEKSGDFSSNQTMRVLDQIGNDIAVLFNTKYLGNVPNDNAGRISLWNDIVRHHQQLEGIRAIENFKPDELTVTQGDTKKSVVVRDSVTPTNAMAQLYMTVVVQ